MIPYVISWVDRVTIKGCSLNFATLKPFTKPTAAPTPNTIRSTTGMGIADVMLGNTLNTVVSKEAEIHAARPTTRPGGNIRTSQYDTAADPQGDGQLCRRQGNNIYN